jgi:choline dehydrogenase-like flavoprotein
LAKVMLLDLEKSKAPPNLDCDICIIGGGAVGLMIATQLARVDRRVVLLEAGGVGLEQRSQDAHRGTSVGHPFKHLESRYRVLGGTTTFWGGQVIPFGQIVWDHRPWIANHRWPFERTTLDPYYLDAYKLLGLGDVELSDASVWRLLGSEPPELSDELELVLTRWVPVRNFARLFRKEIEISERLTVVVHANVTHFALDETNRRISEVHSRTLAGNQLVVRSQSTVLACGTIEIARLLLQPLTGDKRAPWHDNHWVGRGFLDHLDSIAGQVKIIDWSAFHRLFDSIYIGGFKYYPKIRLSRVTQRQEQLVDIAAQFVFHTKYTEHLENIKMFVRSIFDGRLPDDFWAVPGHMLSVSKIALPLAARYVRYHRSFKPRDARVELALFSEQIPHADSRIRLGTELDALGMRRVEVDWKINGQELRTFNAFARRIRDTFASRRLALITLDPDLEGEDPAFFTRVADASHQMSTARIGLTARDGVVDANLRVHGTENLYVAGAAVFPTTGFANPTLTAIALGLRLCKHLTAIRQ